MTETDEVQIILSKSDAQEILRSLAFFEGYYVAKEGRDIPDKLADPFERLAQFVEQYDG